MTNHKDNRKQIKWTEDETDPNGNEFRAIVDENQKELYVDIREYNTWACLWLPEEAVDQLRDLLNSMEKKE